MIHLLSVFPDLLTYSTLAPLLLRVLLGIIFIDLGYLALTTEKKVWIQLFELIRIKPARFFSRLLAMIQIIGGALLIVGAYTQLVTLIFAIIISAECFLEKRDAGLLRRDFVFYVLLLAISLSLLLTGAGSFAIDLPL